MYVLDLKDNQNVRETFLGEVISQKMSQKDIMKHQDFDKMNRKSTFYL